MTNFSLFLSDKKQKKTRRIKETKSKNPKKVYLKFPLGRIDRVASVVGVQLLRLILQPLVEVVALTIESEEEDGVLQFRVAFLIVVWTGGRKNLIDEFLKGTRSLRKMRC